LLQGNETCSEDKELRCVEDETGVNIR
jgi:hypothetical protein